MHCGLTSNVNDFIKCTRSITLDRISEFHYWPMNWHLEHQMFAGMPCYNFKKLHKLVAYNMPKVRILTGAWREMMEIAQRQKVDPAFEFYTPVLPKKNHNQAIHRTSAESIDDLAPRSLK